MCGLKECALNINHDKWVYFFRIRNKYGYADLNITINNAHIKTIPIEKIYMFRYPDRIN